MILTPFSKRYHCVTIKKSVSGPKYQASEPKVVTAVLEAGGYVLIQSAIKTERGMSLLLIDPEANDVLRTILGQASIPTICTNE
jgi:hypothetical protein